MKKLSFLFLLLAINGVRAQSNRNVEDHQVQFGLPLPAILYEAGIGKNSTLSVEAVAGLWIRGCTGCTTEFGVYPIFRGQYRYYYNMERRLDKGKNISGNTGNYVGGLLLYQDGTSLLGDLNTLSTIAVGPVYGLQRIYKNGFFYRLETGLAYYEDNSAFDNNGVTLVLAARLGWVIGGRKK